MLKICSLTSGSKGNCIYISDGSSIILIDAGVPYSQIKNSLKAIGADVSDVEGIIVTHEHHDHIAGLARAASEGIKIYAHPLAQRAIEARTGLIKFEQVDFYDSGFYVGGVRVNPFRVPHDAAYPLGYTLTSGGDKIGVVTDAGHITDGIVNNLTGSRTVFLEANHDREMLLGGSYAKQLKKRIDGANGHLNNGNAGEIACRVAGAKLERIILGHLSEENNTPELAFSTVVEALYAKGVREGRDVEVEVALQNKTTDIF